MSKRRIHQVLIEKPSSLGALTSSEDVALKVMSIMKENFGALPKEFWMLSKAADLLAPRGLVVGNQHSFDMYHRRFDSLGAYPIVSFKIQWWRGASEPIVILPRVKTVFIEFWHFDGDLKLCEDVEELVFDELSAFDRPLELPSSLRNLVLGRGYNRSLTLPLGLKEISFAEKSRYNLPMILPANIRKVKLDPCYNQPLTFTPLIEELELGSFFNQSIDLTPCTKLRVVTFGQYYNMPVHLPHSLEEVYFGNSFNTPVDFPQNLRKVRFGEMFDCPLTLPPRLEHLLFYEGGFFNQALNLLENSSLKTLQLSEWFDHPIDLVEGLESIYFGDQFDTLVVLPSSLKKLEFAVGSVFNQEIELPSGLTCATFGKSIKQHVVFPSGLENLTWNSDFPVNLVEGVQHVTFGPLFKQELILPSSLKSLFLDQNYTCSFRLPPGCVRNSFWNPQKRKSTHGNTTPVEVEFDFEEDP